MVECLYIAHEFGLWAHPFRIQSNTPSRERKRELGRTKNKKLFMAMTGGMSLILFSALLLIIYVSFVVCNITG